MYVRKYRIGIVKLMLLIITIIHFKATTKCETRYKYIAQQIRKGMKMNPLNDNIVNNNNS